MSFASSLLPLADVDFAEANWLLVVKSLVIFAVILGLVPLILLLERKLLGRFQARYGPNRVGPYGLLQPLADVLKLLSKESYKPEAAVPVLWAIAPALVILSATATLAIIPFGIHTPALVGVLVMLAKIVLLICFFIWVRATLPRLRYDQLMSLGWKVLLPLATLNVLVTAVLVVVL